jgi:hypothetical protein
VVVLIKSTHCGVIAGALEVMFCHVLPTSVVFAIKLAAVPTAYPTIGPISMSCVLPPSLSIFRVVTIVVSAANAPQTEQNNKIRGKSLVSFIIGVLLFEV